MVGYRSAMAGTVLCLLVAVSSFVQLTTAAAAASGGRPPAMFVFGDSTLDIGNNNFLAGPDVPRVNKPYYGIDFPGSVATGRFSNGYNIADYLGVSYASGGAGILDSTNAGNNIPLSKQVQYFRSTKSQLVAKLGSRAANLLLAKSVFLFSVGSNDLFVFAVAEENKSAADQQRDAAALYASLISGYSAAIQSLHALGARKFAVINVGLLGCVPAVRLHDATGALNDLASGFDDVLASMFSSIASFSSSRLPGFAYLLANYYGLSTATFADPGAVGYTDIAAACCGGGRLGAEAPSAPNATVCADRDRHAFWVAVHPSQRGAMLTAQNFYDSRPGRYTAPVNFKELAQTSL